VKKLRVLDLFSGIGGFSLGLERTGGFETVAFCEIEEFPRRVLAKHWPEVPCYEDVRELTAERLAADGIAVDVITGGFPCQDISAAGKQSGISRETRSGLWSEIVRLTGELSPPYLIVENVSNLLSGPSAKRGGWFGRVLGDLAQIGYDAEWHCISAANFGAPHIRDRVWLLAHPVRKRQHEPQAASATSRNEERNTEAHWEDGRTITGPIVPGSEVFPNAKCIRQPEPWRTERRLCSEAKTKGETGRSIYDRGWRTEPCVGRVAHGVPYGMDRIATLGNAVVPQIPEMIGYAILEAERVA